MGGGGGEGEFHSRVMNISSQYRRLTLLFFNMFSPWDAPESYCIGIVEAAGSHATDLESICVRINENAHVSDGTVYFMLSALPRE